MINFTIIGEAYISIIHSVLGAQKGIRGIIQLKIICVTIEQK